MVLSLEERERLEKLISTGRTSSKRQIQARILLKADTLRRSPEVTHLCSAEVIHLRIKE